MKKVDLTIPMRIEVKVPNQIGKVYDEVDKQFSQDYVLVDILMLANNSLLLKFEYKLQKIQEYETQKT